MIVANIITIFNTYFPLKYACKHREHLFKVSMTKKMWSGKPVCLDKLYLFVALLS